MTYTAKQIQTAGIELALGHHTARQLAYYGKARQWFGYCAGTAWMVAQLQLAMIEFYPAKW